MEHPGSSTEGKEGARKAAAAAVEKVHAKPFSKGDSGRDANESSISLFCRLGQLQSRADRDCRKWKRT